MAYLWFKTLHIIFVVAWFAGLFYLPRLFVYHCAVDDLKSHERFVMMERKLYRFTSFNASLAVLWALLMLWQSPIWLSQHWLWLKLLGVFALLGFHGYCYRVMQQFATQQNTRSHRWYRWFNEIPTLLLAVMVALVIFKPNI
jgi:protoporphyrinogen IX oxidase